ncbi:MAG: ABC transporter permease [Acidimicrobiia bacterium]
MALKHPPTSYAAGSAWATYLRDLWQRREFALYLALGKLKARNASTALGLFWWVLNPLMLASIYFLVFGFIFQARRGHPAYLSHLLSGMFAFYYTQSAVTGGVGSIISNAKLLANLGFPRLVLPVSSLIEAAVGFGASLVAYFAITIPADGLLAGPTIWWLLPAFGLHTLFNLGLSAATARFTVPFRDLNNLVPYLMRLWLYLSPILYTLDRVPESIQGLFRLNPLVPFLDMYRAALMGSPLEGQVVLAATLWAAGMAAVGVWLFARSEGYMVRYL